LFIGAYVTTGAKIHLYRYLDRLQENAMYCDTVSVIHIPALIETGDKLTDMTSEFLSFELRVQTGGTVEKQYVK